MIRRRQLLACGASVLPMWPVLAAGQDATASRRLPIETLFKKPAFGSAVLSPDQKHLAAIAPSNGRLNLAVYNLETRRAVGLTSLANSDVASVFWANNGRILFTTGDQQGLEFRGDGGLFGIDVDGANPTTLVKSLAVSGAYVPRLTRVLRRVPGSPDEVLVAANDRTADSPDVYRMNVRTGRKTLVNISSPGNVVNWVLDQDGTPRAAFCFDVRKVRYWFAYLPDPKGRDWKILAEWDEKLEGVTIPLAFDPTRPELLFVASNKGRDTMALFHFDPASGKLGELIYGDDRHDVFSSLLIGSSIGDGGRLIFAGAEDAPAKLAGLAYIADKPRYVWFDEQAARAQAGIDAAFPGAYNTFDITAARTLVFTRSDTNPGAYYLFDRQKRALEDTGIRTRPDIDPKAMRPMQPVSFTARDGLRIDGYLTLPADFRKGQPVPLVLHPHGGPWARDVWAYNPEVQFMASRGFAVLQVNFRGSTGYGAKHLRLSFKQWGGTMIDDLIDGVDWAVREGFADRSRVGVYGASYGGYATLMALVKRPDMFKWGINYVGVTDMAVHQDTQPAQRGEFGELAKRLNGDQKADTALFESHSPSRMVKRISVPVFHAYGGEDRNVDIANGRVIRAAFDEASKPYEWMLVDSEAHGYRQDRNVFDFYSRVERFMQTHTPRAPAS